MAPKGGRKGHPIIFLRAQVYFAQIILRNSRHKRSYENRVEVTLLEEKRKEIPSVRMSPLGTGMRRKA